MKNSPVGRLSSNNSAAGIPVATVAEVGAGSGLAAADTVGFELLLCLNTDVSGHLRPPPKKSIKAPL